MRFTINTSPGAKGEAEIMAACARSAENANTEIVVATVARAETEEIVEDLAAQHGGEFDGEAGCWKWKNGSTLRIEDVEV